MSDSQGSSGGSSGGSGENETARPGGIVATEITAAGPRPSAPPYRLLIFTGVLGLTFLSLGSAVLVLSGATKADTTTASNISTTSRAASPAAGARTASVAPAAVRVTSASGSAGTLGGSTYRVSFVWALDGAKEGDVVLVRVFAGTRLLSELRGALDQSVYAAATGRLTIATSLDCSADGWSAELVSVRDQPISGDGTAKVAGVACR